MNRKAIWLLPVLLVCLCFTALADGAAGALREPVVEADEAMPGGARVTWSCVYFGSYPATEIVDGEFTAVPEEALRQGDVVSDKALYERLSQAEWTQGEATLDGARYRRMQAGDAVSWALARPQHYAWDDEHSWHYFRYEPIKWRVIELNDGVATLMADRLPDCAPFNTEAVDVFWENCTLRSFLNGYDASENLEGISFADSPRDSFLNTAFSDSERQALVRGPVENANNYYFGTACGNDTEDFVYIMSESEVFSTELASRHGFVRSDGIGDAARRFTPTLYAMARGAWFSPVAGHEGNGFWFMRTSGYTPANVTYICDFGYVYNRGIYVTCNDSGLLPVVRVDLSLAELADAGVVCSDEMEG